MGSFQSYLAASDKVFYLFFIVFLLDMCYNVRDYYNPGRLLVKIICNFVICDAETEYRVVSVGMRNVKMFYKHQLGLLQYYSIYVFCIESTVNLC